LIAEIELADVNTNYFENPTLINQDEVRVSVGWRNPEEDGYDVTV